MSLLEVRDIVVRFGGITAVDDASISVEAGRIAALIGPNGAGKTTTFNVISGLQEPTSGSVVFEGRDITRKSVQQRARLGLARTFQRLEVFGSLTVADNIRVAAEIVGTYRGTEERPEVTVDRLIERIGLQAFRDQPADSIPTGVARLTELARALTTEPKVLLLDEPSSGLNEEESDALAELLRGIAAEGRAILMVEHDVDLVMSVCEWIDVLDFGRIIASGPAADVQADPIVQAAYLGAEVDKGEVA